MRKYQQKTVRGGNGTKCEKDGGEKKAQRGERKKTRREILHSTESRKKMGDTMQEIKR